MRLFQLYLRSRLAGQALVLLTLIAVATGLTLWLSAGEEGFFGLALVFMPLAASVVIAAGTQAPFGEREQAAGYALPALRLVHLLGLLGWAALGLMGGATFWSANAVSGLTPAGEAVQPGSVAWWLARNLLGFAGVVFLAAHYVGSGRAWVIALVHGVLTVMFLLASPFGWPLRPAGDLAAAVAAVVSLGVGLGVVVRKGVREEEGVTTA